MRTFQRRVFHLGPADRSRLTTALHREVAWLHSQLNSTPVGTGANDIRIAHWKKALEFCTDTIHQLNTPARGHVEIHFIADVEAAAIEREYRK